MPAACPASPKQHTGRKGSILPCSTPSPWRGSEGVALPGPFSGLGLHPMRMISHATTGDWGSTHTTSHIQGHQHRFGNHWARPVALSGAAHPRQMMTGESIPPWKLSQETTTPIEHQVRNTGSKVKVSWSKSKYHGLLFHGDQSQLCAEGDGPGSELHPKHQHRMLWCISCRSFWNKQWVDKI